METIELFSATESFSKVAVELGHNKFSIELYKKFNPDLCISVLDLKELPFRPNVFWASPPCTAFSVASIGHHWTGGCRAYIPKTEGAKLGLQLLDHTIYLLSQELKINPKMIWFIENPRGLMRKLIDEIFKKHSITKYKRETIWYCQYGDSRAKPTDVWTNLIDWEGKTCRNYNKKEIQGLEPKHCHHEQARRGAKTGTQGLKGNMERSVIPPELFKEIFSKLTPICLKPKENDKNATNKI